MLRFFKNSMNATFAMRGRTIRTVVDLGGKSGHAPYLPHPVNSHHTKMVTIHNHVSCTPLHEICESAEQNMF